MNENIRTQRQEKYQFKIHSGEQLQSGEIIKAQVIGSATLFQGRKNYYLHLFMFQKDQFFLVPHKSNPARYYIMTRRPWKEQNRNGKFSWNIVGYAVANGKNSCLELNFDLLTRPLYMSMFPEKNESNKYAA